MLISERELPALREELAGRRVVLGVGTFGIMHVGYKEYLNWAEDLAGPGGIVAVMVRRDQRAALQRGVPPAIPEDERAELIDFTKPVDFTFLGPDTVPGMKTSMRAAQLLRPTIVAMGDGWKSELPRWRIVVPEVTIAVAPFAHRRSTSEIIRRIRGV